MAKNILHTILETKRKEVQQLHETAELDELRRAARDAPPPRNFFSAVTKRPRRLLNVIAEIKKASPSAGVIREDFDPVAIARTYADAGADALSVLTDEQYFQGKLEYLTAAREASGLPVLRKDFIIDPWQVYQSRAAGADAILLIAAAVKPGQLLDLMILATELRMTSLVEVHDASELMEVRSAIGFPHRSYGLLGINNRDLTSFEVDLNNTIRLIDLADERMPVISESGIKTRQDVQRLRRAGVKGILVGETLMRCEDVAAALRELVGQAR